ncbi:hypothetical protein G7Y89_g3398 [Cudoniella acicularis]|uniref:Uncharacterized protein n=1 Tax=Cudoniella acicularis TaxID=354080 RepID=A0A8H4RTF0_9HELO|nr:hypothetical protein G7Y89_g3398 [Cudoniella acicularis]
MVEHTLPVSHADKTRRKEILDIQLNGLPAQGAPRTVFVYATSFDVVIIIFSCIAAIIAGALNPLLTIIYGQLVGSLQAFTNGSIGREELKSQIARFTLYYVYLAVGVFVFIYITTVGFYYTGERITRSLRRAYLQAIIRQNMAFFDLLGAGEVTTRITSDMNLIQEGITSKISLSLTATATFTTAFIIAFVEYWKLALILSSVIVAILIAGAVGGKFAVKYNRESLASYSAGATIVEEAIGSIRHVTAFGIQEQLAQRYHAYLLEAEVSGIKARIAIAIMISVMMATPYFSYGLSFWQGSRYLVAGEVGSASIVTTTFAILIGAFSIGRVAPNTQAFVSSIASAGNILKTISRRSPQDPLSSKGRVPSEVKGALALKNVSLVYPSRSDEVVLDDISLEFPAATTTAIVGASGCGKSSIVGLIERFYTPVDGQIVLDGNDIQSLNLRWLRRQISFVGQEPILFGTTIFENISLGLTDEFRAARRLDLNDMVIDAAKKANAHDFVISLPRSYETEVGERGLQLSGGQRQRIAIARALISDPTILLLDEATSALDSKSERAVQVALESAARGRTTIVIAHRLSTIQNADNIVVMSKGKVMEQGNHGELMARDSLYSALVQKQQFEPSAEKQEDGLSIHEGTSGMFSDEEKSSFLFEDKKETIGKEIRVDYNSSGSDRTTSSAQDKELSEAPPLTLWRTVNFMWNLHAPERLILILGLLCCIIAGLIIPTQSVFLAEMVNSLALPPDRYKDLRHDVNFWSLMFLMVAIIALIVWIGHGVCFSYTTERLTRRVRDRTLRTILRQNIGYFDLSHNSTGALTALVSTGTTDLNSLNGAVIGNILTFISVLTGGIILSLAIGWKLALVCSCTIPAVAACGWVRLRMLALFDTKVRKTHQESATYASEIITAIRTVSSLSLEDHVLDYYSKILAKSAAKSLQSILKASTLYALSQSFNFLCSALAYWYGSTLLADHEYTLLQFFICFAALITGSQIAGSIFSYAPDMSKAMHAAAELKSLFEKQPAIDTWSNAGDPVVKEKSRGQIELRNVSFVYPTRPERLVLNNFNLSVHPGQYIALVGSSGCGKSTLISLLERFFDPINGQILVDGADISKLNVNDYRNLISLVGQEPTVYQGTIRENVVLGSAAEISDEAVIQACKEANIYSFIDEGFSTIVGSRGCMLSGGQKQRIAIARALLRNTKILLLDEATSALDSDSERIVQEALDVAAKHRTTIAVAHRLSTIQRADLICVLDQGSLVESGTHGELMAKQGAYFELVEMQSLEESARTLGLN